MGGESSKKCSSPQCEDAKRLFTADELQRTADIFNTICQQNKNCLTFEKFTADQFKRYIGAQLSEKLVAGTYIYLDQVQRESKPDSHEQHGITMESFIIAASHIFKGTLEEKASFVMCIAKANNPQGSLSDSLHATITTLVLRLKTILQTRTVLTLWDDDAINRLSNAMLLDLPDMKHGADDYSTQKVVQTWLAQNTLMLNIIQVVMASVLSVLEAESTTALLDNLMPQCTAKDTSVSALLDAPSVVYLSDAICRTFTRTPWRRVYSAEKQGLSFGTMLKAIADQGPSILVVRDTDGHVYGGFTSHSWKANAQFTGSGECFLFQIRPCLRVFHTSSHNENYMYLNSGQETLPNGLGMGGQLEYFGLHLSDDFGRGCSRTCSTYNSPQLSKQTQFMFDEIEVWAVGPKCRQPTQGGEEGSILDADPSGEAMLEMIGRGPVSKGIREADKRQADNDKRQADNT